ncbi:MAG TPA: hypothetical protein VFA58_08710 [Chthoniobacterales bacterium]|nr:hypothetical protein [Chthoniobacterales bacterium]
MPRKAKTDPAETGKITKPKVRAKSTSARAKRPSAGKKRAAESVTARATRPTAPGFALSDNQIEMRAYFISERRRRLDLPGDANSDWLEAKRQLLAETRH